MEHTMVILKVIIIFVVLYALMIIGPALIRMLVLPIIALILGRNTERFFFIISCLTYFPVFVAGGFLLSTVLNHNVAVGLLILNAMILISISLTQPRVGIYTKFQQKCDVLSIAIAPIIFAIL
jgi:hypothetical protein